MAKGRKVRISNSALNQHGTRVLTEGVELEQYKKNPVLLYMHERGQVIGYMMNVEIQGDDITGDIVFDEVTELSQRCKKQYEAGSLRMVSAGLIIREMSEDPSVLVPGQTRPTITRSRLYEVSVVDIGANDDSLVLRMDGRDMSADNLPLLSALQTDNTPNKKDMELKELNKTLGLQEGATEEQAMSRLNELKATEAQLSQIRQQQQEAEMRMIGDMVDQMVSNGLVDTAKREDLLNACKDAGYEAAHKMLSAMNAHRTQPARVSSVIQMGVQSAGGAQAWYKLSDVPASELMELRTNNRSEYERLYQAEYGMNPEIND